MNNNSYPAPIHMTPIVLAAWLAAPCCATGWAGQASPPAAAPPTAARAATPKMVHYFGVIQPNQVANHRFEVRNTGGADLELSGERGSCKCLEVQVEPRVVKPGAAGEVRVRWRAGDEIGKPFRQLVQVRTNDPQRRTIEFVVTGDVGGHVQVNPSRVEWRNAKRGEPQTARVQVGSTFWERVRLVEVASSVDGLRVEVQDVPAERRVNRLARSAKQLVLTAPPELTREDFFAVVNFTLVRADDVAEPATPPLANGSPNGSGPPAEDAAPRSFKLQLPVTFSLAPPLSVIGGGYDAERSKASLGIQRPGEETVRRYLVKVRDADKRLAIKSTRVEPDFLDVALQPYKPSAGLYRLVIRCPPNRLDRAYVGRAAGELHLQFDHPRIDSLTWALEISPSL